MHIGRFDEGISMTKKIYQITEYGSFIADKQVDGYTTLPPTVFEQLENFILSNRFVDTSKNTEPCELMGISIKKGLGKVITAKNYIGVLSLKDGTTAEILPKISSKMPQKEQHVKKLVVDMIKTCTELSYKSFQFATVDIEKMDLFELFIRMFLDETFLLIKKGRKGGYETVTTNDGSFKGKLLFSEQIRHNLIHKERSFVAFDEFTANCPENRLIKSTLLYLYRQTNSFRNKTDLKTLLTIFDDVSESANFSSDFSKATASRNSREYMTLLLWSRIFLSGKSFTSFAGSEVAFALLFPMETLFERYVATQLKKMLNTDNFSISIQDTTYHLFTLPTKKFLLKPDIVIRRKSDNAVFICDTKWKLLSNEKQGYGISQSDMYQMYAYQKKYNARTVILLYPQTDQLADEKIVYDSGDGVVVQVQFIDLFDIKNSLAAITGYFN